MEAEAARIIFAHDPRIRRITRLALARLFGCPGRTEEMTNKRDQTRILFDSEKRSVKENLILRD
jgi:5-bromo-4-chloroindolyl phosphate hydrolysis protein